MSGIYPRPIVLAVYQRTEADEVVVSVSVYGGEVWRIVLPETTDLVAALLAIEHAWFAYPDARVSIVTRDTERRVHAYGRREGDRRETSEPQRVQALSITQTWNTVGTTFTEKKWTADGDTRDVMDAAPITHYVPWFTRRAGEHQAAACGAFVTASDIASPNQMPTCPGCAAFVS